MPGLAAILTEAYSPVVPGRRVATPHFGTRQIVHVTHHAPHPTLHGRFKGDPVRRVGPTSRHALGRTRPALAAVFAAEQADVGIRDEHSARIKGIKKDPIT